MAKVMNWRGRHGMRTLIQQFVFLLATCFSGIAAAFADSGIGQQLADYSANDATAQPSDCFKSAYNRLKHIYDKNGKTLPSIYGTENQNKPFKMLWNTNYDLEGWKNIDATHRASGPPGALAAEGLAEIVGHDDIWSGKLKPGALVQTWDLLVDRAISGKRSNGVKVFKKLHAGKPISGHIGHVFIFLEYVQDSSNKIVGMRIADQGTCWQPQIVSPL